MYNQLQEAAQAQDDQLEAQVLALSGPPVSQAACQGLRVARRLGNSPRDARRSACVAADHVSCVSPGSPARSTGGTPVTAGEVAALETAHRDQSIISYPAPTRPSEHRAGG